MEEWQPGQVIADRYRLQKRIGSGGMGDVWKAEHVKLRSPVAIKVLRASIAKDKELAARFLREAQAAAAIRSTNVVQVLDYGREGHAAYIAMEFLEGESLRKRLAQHERLTAEETAHILTQVGRAVSRAHRSGIVHRDLKPANIQLVDEEGIEVVKVLDFGIAKVLESFAPTSESLETDEGMESTRTGTLLGTPYYMSPEQLRGRRTIDLRTDVWSMGVIAYQCIVGNRPFDGETLGDLVMRVCAEPPPIPSEQAEVPEGFDAWFARATALEPDERFATVKELVTELRAVLLEESVPQSRRALEGFEDSTRSERNPGVTPLPPEPLGNTSRAQNQTLSTHRSEPPRSIADAAGGGRGLLGLGLLAVAGAVIFVAMRMGDPPDSTDSPDSPDVPQPASVGSADAIAEPGDDTSAGSSADDMLAPSSSASASSSPPAASNASTSASTNAPSASSSTIAAPPPQPAPTPAKSQPKEIDFGF